MIFINPLQINIYASLDLATSLATKANIKKAATNPSKYNKAMDIAAKSAPNKTIFLKAPSARTKGLKSTKFLKAPGNVSIGSIVFEKNSIRLAAATAHAIQALFAKTIFVLQSFAWVRTIHAAQQHAKAAATSLGFMKQQDLSCFALARI